MSNEKWKSCFCHFDNKKKNKLSKYGNYFEFQYRRGGVLCFALEIDNLPTPVTMTIQKSVTHKKLILFDRSKKGVDSRAMSHFVSDIVSQ